MKLVKLTMLAATAALAGSAFIGASSASAVTHPWYAVCLGGVTPLLLCEVGQLAKHPLLGRFEIAVGPGKFNSGFVTVECEKGTGISNEVESQQNGAFKATLESLAFTGCKGCTGVKVTTPQNVVVNMATDGGNDYRLKTETTPGKVEFSGCPFGTTCFYEGELDFEVQMNEKGVFVEPKGKELKKGAGSGSLCAATGKWESGTATVGWLLDDLKHSIHPNIWISLLHELTLANGTEL